MPPPDVRPALRESTATTAAGADETRPWHAIRSARGKWYSYRLALGPTLRDPTERYTRAHFACAVAERDVERLRSILRLYEGTHDFRAFGGQIEQNGRKRGSATIVDTVRTVYRVELVKEPTRDGRVFGNDRDGGGGGGRGGGGPSSPPKTAGLVGEEGYYRIDFLLQGALYRMVRNMVGTAMDCWLGRIPEDRIVDMLRIDRDDDEDGEREDDDAIVVGRLGRKDNPCKPAPPEGLTLECVYYGDGF